jgi:hypothetical protein
VSSDRLTSGVQDTHETETLSIQYLIACIFYIVNALKFYIYIFINLAVNYVYHYSVYQYSMY